MSRPAGARILASTILTVGALPLASQSVSALRTREAIVAVRGLETEDRRTGSGRFTLSERTWSGIVVDSTGRVLTVAHAFPAETRQLWVQTLGPSATTRLYDVIVRAPELDLAVLQPGTEFQRPQPFVDLRRSSKSRQGMTVFAWGAVPPSSDSGAVLILQGLIRNRDTSVAVTSESEPKVSAIVATTSTWAGFSGGLLSDSLGVPIGVLRARIVESGDRASAVAVPASDAVAWMARALRPKTRERPSLLARLAAGVSGNMPRPLSFASNDTAKSNDEWMKIAGVLLILYLLSRDAEPASSTVSSGPSNPIPSEDPRSSGRIPPIAEPAPPTEEARIQRRDSHESAALTHYLQAEKTGDQREADLAIAEYETARTYRTSISSVWCGATYRIGLLYKWKGRPDLSRELLRELRAGRATACSTLAIELQRALGTGSIR